MQEKISMKLLYSALVISALLIFNVSCVKEKPLPIFGERDFNGTDTVYHTIPPFQLVDQDSVTITNKTFAGKIYVADFFFTKCPTICPVMKTQMLRIHDEFQTDSDVLILSHTIDPEYDNVSVLHDYSDRLGVKSNKWHFVTGDMDDIYGIAEKGYFTRASVDETLPGGFLHSGAFLLVDRYGRVRGQYDGTKEDQVDRLIQDIKRLKKEE
jgi:protein SCO1